MTQKPFAAEASFKDLPDWRKDAMRKALREVIKTAQGEGASVADMPHVIRKRMMDGLVPEDVFSGADGDGYVKAILEDMKKRGEL